MVGPALDLDVVRATPGTAVSRVSTKAPVHLELADGTFLDVWIKGYFGAGWSARRAGIPEASFYRDLALTSGIRTLGSVYAAIDPESQANVVITQDVLGQGAQFLDSLSDYTPDQMAESLSQLAVLHSATWLRPEYAKLGWLASRFDRYTVNRGVQQRGPSLVDVGYHIASALSIDDRRRHEFDLVRHYVERLAHSGGAIANAKSMQHELCLGIVHGFYLWGITLKVEPAMTAVLLRRLGTAADDHDVFGVLGL